MLTKIIYFCNCQAVNWSYKDELSTTSLDNLNLEESTLHPLGLIDTEDNELFTPSSLEITLGENGSTTTYKAEWLIFIKNEIQKVLKSPNLTQMVKYVYWLVLYCINSYFIHLKKLSPLEVLTK